MPGVLRWAEPSLGVEVSLQLFLFPLHLKII